MWQYRRYGAIPGSSMTRPVGGAHGTPSLLPPVTAPVPGVQVAPTLAAPHASNLGMAHQSGWEGLSGGAAPAHGVPGGSIFDTSAGAPGIDDAMLEDIADQAVAQLMPGGEEMSDDELDAYGSFFRVQDDEWDALEEEEMLVGDEDDDEYGRFRRRMARRRFMRRHPRMASRMRHRRQQRRAHRGYPQQPGYQPQPGYRPPVAAPTPSYPTPSRYPMPVIPSAPITKPAFTSLGAPVAGAPVPGIKSRAIASSRFGTEPGYDVPPGRAPSPPVPGPAPSQEGTFTSSVKMGAGLALGFFAVGLGLAVVTGAGRK